MNGVGRSLTEAEWIALHEMDERIMRRCEDCASIYRGGTEAEYERVLDELQALIAGRYPFGAQASA